MADESRKTGPQGRKDLDTPSSGETGDISSPGTSEEMRESSSREMGPQGKEDLDTPSSEETGDISSPGTSEEKSEASTRETGPVDESRSPLHTSGSSSVAEEKSEPPPDSSKGDKSTSKVTGAFAKWDSPPKTKEPVMITGSPKETMQATSPDKRGQRPATIASGGKKIAGKISAATKKIANFFHSSKPSDSDEASLIQHDAASRVSGEGPSSKETKELQTRVRPPKFADLTGQEGGYLHPLVSMCQDSVDESTTEVTRLSGSVSLGDKDSFTTDPSCRLDSREGSTGDDSSLEREFDELSSPSKSAQQGLKRSKTANESSDSEDEGRAALGLCGSPRKRVELKKPDPGAGKPKDP